MIRRVLLLGALWGAWLGGAAAADTIGVRSGDHDGFTRLVFSIPAGTSWQLGRVGAGYGLRLEADAEVSTDGVFARIGRQRLADLDVVAGGVDLTLACDCHLDAFLYRPDSLVVDVVDGPPAAGSDFETALPGGPAPQPPAPPPAVRTAVLPLVLPGQLPPGAPALPTAAQAPSRDATRPVAGRDSAEALAETEARLLESLAEAAAAGLVALDPSLRRDQPVPAAAPPAPEPPPSEPQGPGIAARTGLGTRTPGQSAGAAPFCPPAGEFDVTAWSDPDERFDAGLARVRDGLTDEDGRPTADGARALARFYIASGLGREALVTLDLVEHPLPERQTLAAIARLLDDRRDGPSFPTAMPGCAGPVQLWSILIRGTTAGVASADLAAAQAAFVQLPESLVGLLGPQFSRILIEEGHALAADSIYSDMRRSHGVVEPEAALAEADLALTQAGPEAAVEALSETASDPGRLSPESVVQLIELSLRGGIPVAEQTLTLASALRYEQRGTPDAGALARAEIRARIAADDFARALQLISEAVADLAHAGPGAADALQGEALAAFASRADDDGFLDAAFRPLPPGTGDDVRANFADRLEALGFPERAAEVRDGDRPALAPPDPAPDPLLDAAPTQAEPEPLPEPAASQATEPEEPSPEPAAPEPEPAPAVPVEAGPQPAQAGDTLQAWRSGEWAALADGTDPLLSSAASAALSAGGGEADGPPLAARERLLSDTEATRTMIRDLLDRFPAPDLPQE